MPRIRSKNIFAYVRIDNKIYKIDREDANELRKLPPDQQLVHLNYIKTKPDFFKIGLHSQYETKNKNNANIS